MTTPTEIYNWYKRYKVLAADMTELQSQLLDRPSGMMEGIFAGSILSGLEAATTGGMSVQINTGLAVGPTGYFHVVDSITTVNLTAPTGSNPVRSLIVARPSLTDSDLITNPTNPFDTVPLRTTLGSAVTLLPGTAASSPSYPGTESNDVVLCGVRTYPGQTSITVADIDLTVRDNVAKNASGLQNAAQFDDRLRPYRLTSQILGVRPSQLSGSNQKQFKASANNRAAIFPKTPGGDFNANDTFLNFQTGAVTGGDGATGSFTPSIPSAGNCIVATVLLTTNNTLSVSYGTAGTRAQCFDGIQNQEASGAGSVSIPTTGQPIAFVLVSSSNGTTVTEIDFFDARGILQGGGGAGGDPTFINYFVDPDFEATPVGTVPENFSTYNDGATAVPVDGTGGTVTGVTFLASDSSPIRGSVSGVLTKDAANRQGMGLAYTFTIPSVDKSTLALVRFELLCSTDYAAGDIVLYVYDVTNSTLITPSNTSLPDLPTNGGKHQYTFLLGTGTQYRLLWHIATTNASAYTVKFDTMVCSTTPQVVASDSVFSLGTFNTVTSQGFGTPSSINIEYERVDRFLKASGNFVAGTVSSDEARLNFYQTGITASGSYIVGKWWRGVSGANQRKTGTLISASSLNYLRFGSDDYTTAESPFSASAGNGVCSNGQTIYFEYFVPIAEWVGNSPNLGPGAQVEYASNSSTSTTTDDTVSFQYGPSGAQIQNITTALKRRVRFQYPIQTDDIILLEVSDDRLKWAEVTGWGLNSAGTIRSMEYQLANGKTYGMGSLSIVNTTDVDVYFGTYATIDTTSATYGANGTAWSAGAGSFYWRVRKAKASAPVGFGKASVSNGFGLMAPAKGQYDLTFSSTPGGWSLARAKGIYYQDQDGNHRLRFNIAGTITSTATGSFTISGVTFKNVTNLYQACSATQNNAATTYVSYCHANPNTGQLSFGFSAGVTVVGFSGDVELESAPTWA